MWDVSCVGTHNLRIKREEWASVRFENPDNDYDDLRSFARFGSRNTFEGSNNLSKSGEIYLQIVDCFI